MSASIICTKNLKKKFKQGNKTLTVLDGVSVEFDAEKSYAVTGVSGTGKSTFLQLLAGLDQPDEGSVLFQGSDLARLTPSQKSSWLRTQVGLVFQDPHLIAELTVCENVALKGLIADHDMAHAREHAQKLLAHVGIEQKADEYPRSLSGGQQQRAAIARALYGEPRILMTDEPTGNLDIATGKTIIDLMITCQKKWGMTLIICSHDPYVTQSVDTVFELRQGQLICQDR